MATVATPISRQVREPRTAISPRLAMRIFFTGAHRSVFPYSRKHAANAQPLSRLRRPRLSRRRPFLIRLVIGQLSRTTDRRGTDASVFHFSICIDAALGLRRQRRQGRRSLHPGKGGKPPSPPEVPP